MKSNKKKLLIGLALSIIFLIIIVIGLIFILNNKKGPQYYGNSKYVIDDSNLIDLDEAVSTAKVDEDMFEISMNTEWFFDNGRAESSNAYVANVSSNRYPVIFEVSFEETGEVLYTSSVIPLGSRIDVIKLDKELEKGNYNAACKYKLLDENGNEISELQVSIVLHIVN